LFVLSAVIAFNDEGDTPFVESIDVIDGIVAGIHTNQNIFFGNTFCEPEGFL